MAAPKGNKYALGCTNNGKPPVYDDPAKLIKKIKEYFETQKPWTITGLSLYCGFASRQSFYDYENKEDFAYIIKRARTVIENVYEEQLQKQNSSGAIFALKNMDWKDHQDHGISFDSPPVIKIIKGNGASD